MRTRPAGDRDGAAATGARVTGCLVPLLVALLLSLLPGLTGTAWAGTLEPPPAPPPRPAPVADEPVTRQLAALRALTLDLRALAAPADGGGWSASTPLREATAVGAEGLAHSANALGHELLLLEEAMLQLKGRVRDPAAVAAGEVRWSVTGREADCLPALPAGARLSSLTIRNLGETTLGSPQVIGTDGRDWSRLTSLLDDALDGAVGERERALALWLWLVESRTHGSPATAKAALHDPVLLMNVFGYGFCDDAAHVLAALAGAAGLQARVWSLNGHVVPEVRVDGHWSLLDPDNEAYFLEADGGLIAGAETLALQPDLLDTPQLPPGRARAFYPVEIVRPFFETTEDNRHAPAVLPPAFLQMDFDLAPGDAIVLSTASAGRRVADSFYRRPPEWANGLLTGRRLLGGAAGARPVVVELPYVFVAGRLLAVAPADDPPPAVAVRAADGPWLTPEWERHAAGWVLPLTDVLPIAAGPLVSRLSLRPAVEGASLAVDVELVVQVAPRSLPELTPGLVIARWRSTSDDARAEVIARYEQP